MCYSLSNRYIELRNYNTGLVSSHLRSISCKLNRPPHKAHHIFKDKMMLSGNRKPFTFPALTVLAAAGLIDGSGHGDRGDSRG